MSWTETELAELRRAYASGTLRVSYDGKSVEYGSAADLLARIRTIEAEIASAAGRPKPRRRVSRTRSSTPWAARTSCHRHAPLSLGTPPHNLSLQRGGVALTGVGAGEYGFRQVPFQSLPAVALNGTVSSLDHSPPPQGSLRHPRRLN